VPDVAWLSFTRNLERHVACPAATVGGTTVREGFEGYFRAHPEVRGYVVDERGALRKHINVFVDGVQIADRTGLSDPITMESKVYVMQALSGG
jgi:molybdopterin synthase sulfur carrier subunit